MLASKSSGPGSRSRYVGQQLTYFVSCCIFAMALFPWGNGNKSLVCLHLEGSEVASRKHSGNGSNSHFYKCIYSMKSSLTLILSPTPPSCLGKHCLVVRRRLLNGFVSITVLTSQPDFGTWEGNCDLSSS